MEFAQRAGDAGGIIEGDVRINGHPKEQETFSRVSGYCEQFDVHVSLSAPFNLYTLIVKICYVLSNSEAP